MLHAPNVENLHIPEIAPLGRRIERWVGTIDHMVLKMNLGHKLTH